MGAQRRRYQRLRHQPVKRRPLRSSIVAEHLRRTLRLPRLGLARVHGVSMEPTLRPGQVLLVRYGVTARGGDVVIVSLPPDHTGQPRPPAVKRLVRIEDDGRLWVESEHPGAAGVVDSWTVGPLDATALQARVLARVSPVGRIPPG